MMERYVAHISGMHCSSCGTLIGKEIERIGGKNISADAGLGTLEFDAEAVALEKLPAAVEAAGYSIVSAHKASEKPGCCKGQSSAQTFRGGISEFISSRSDVLSAWLLSVAATFAISAFAYVVIFKSSPAFGAATLPLLALSGISVSAIAAAGWHLSSYKRQLSCMFGMMEGMTYGMMSGFMAGAILGASSGMFWGTVFGMLIGVGAGIWAGRRSGVMGVMEGVMAGIMSGSMGAMYSVMMFGSPLIYAIGLLVALCLVVLGGLLYMEAKELGHHGKADTRTIVSASVLMFFLLAIIVIYGPKISPVYTG
jgi:copper chaperone CopZ